MEKSKEKKSKVRIFIIIFRIISIIIIGVCLYVLYLWHLDNKANDSLQNDLESLISVDISPTEKDSDESKIDPRFEGIEDDNNINITQFNVDFDELEKKNSDSVAWIRIIGTNISYPVVKAENNDYYLTRNILKEKNGAGWIFADYRNNFENLDKNTIIYGHNRRNGTMFSNLRFYLDESYCADTNHRYINFITKKQKYIAEIFSVYKTTPNNVTLPNEFSNIIELEDTIKSWKENSIYDFGTDITTSDKILTLYTCDNNTSYRILVHAKLIPID